MNLKQIESFVAVADTKGFSQAASLLYITQPTVSAHISTLEDELNTKLIARTTKTVELTEQGEEFYTYAREMLELERKMINMFSSSPKEGKNVLRISSSSVPAQSVLPKVLGEFLKKYPNIKYTIKENDSLNVIKEVCDRKIDVGFTGTQIEEKECRYVHLCKDELVIITPNKKRYKDIDKSYDSIDWIKSEPIIMRQVGSGTRREAERLLIKQGIDLSSLNIVADYNSTETIKRSVINGMGIAFVSKLAIEAELKEKTLLSHVLDPQNKGRSLNMVYNNHVIHSKSAMLFMNFVRDYYK